jgi:hypothetical protein
MCTEGGVWQCDGTGDRECTDVSGDTLEICDGAMVDEDCDGLMNEGFLLDTDESNCGACNVVCPVCSNGANDCDSNPDNGCELRNTTPPCGSATALTAVRGDTGTGGTTTASSGYAEAWFTVVVNETSKADDTGGNLRATVALDVPAGVDFDLFVTCPSCLSPSGSPLSSTNAAGVDELINLRNDDQNGDDDGFTIVIEVRHIGATMCGDWTLTVTGNAGSGGDNIGDGCEL